MYGQGSSRAERVRPNVFWGKTKSGRTHLLGLGPDDRDDVRGADQSEKLNVRLDADCGGRVTPMFLQLEEYFDAHLDRAGCGGL